jgi:hypothetical protein
MSAVVAPQDVERLGKLLGLLGSAHEGERANAAALADRQLRALGLDWHELVGRAFHVPAPAAPTCRPAAGHRATTAWLLSCWPLLSEWERGFVSSAHAQSRLTQRQRAKLDEVARRVETRRGAEAPR